MPLSRYRNERPLKHEAPVKISLPPDSTVRYLQSLPPSLRRKEKLNYNDARIPCWCQAAVVVLLLIGISWGSGPVRMNSVSCFVSADPQAPPAQSPSSGGGLVASRLFHCCPVASFHPSLPLSMSVALVHPVFSSPQCHETRVLLFPQC